MTEDFSRECGLHWNWKCKACANCIDYYEGYFGVDCKKKLPEEAQMLLKKFLQIEKKMDKCRLPFSCFLWHSGLMPREAWRYKKYRKLHKRFQILYKRHCKCAEQLKKYMVVDVHNLTYTRIYLTGKDILRLSRIGLR